MRAGERMVASDGYEVMLFPLPYLYITQGENESYSHAGILAIDFVGWTGSHQQYQAPMYAPCSCRCVATIDAYNNGRVFQSTNRVHTPNGLMYVNFMCFHDDNPIASVGSTFRQGDIFAHTGTAGNVTGDHTHFNTASGTYAGWTHVPPDNNGELVNSTHIYETCYVNDTTLVVTYSYPWVNYSGNLEFNKRKFPWVLYARKLRNFKTYI